MFSRRQHESGTFRATIGDSSARCFIPHPPPPPRCDSSLCLCIFHAPGKKRLSRIAPKKLSPPVPHLSRYNSHPMRTTLPHLLSAKSLPSISPRVTSSFLLSIFTSNTTHFSHPPPYSFSYQSVLDLSWFLDYLEPLPTTFLLSGILNALRCERATAGRVMAYSRGNTLRVC